MSCEPHVTITCFRADEIVPFEINLEGGAINLWSGGHVYGIGERVRPATPNGYEYEATVAGQSARLRGIREPSWPKTIGGTVVDGSVTWTCRALSSQSLRRTPTAVTYTAPSGVTVTDTGLDATAGKARFWGRITGVGSATEDDIVAHVVFSDATHEDIVIRVKGDEVA